MNFNKIGKYVCVGIGIGQFPKHCIHRKMISSKDKFMTDDEKYVYSLCIDYAKKLGVPNYIINNTTVTIDNNIRLNAEVDLMRMTIIVGPDMIKYLDTNKPGPYNFVLAHEVGHLKQWWCIYLLWIPKELSKKLEYDADYSAAKLGFSLEGVEFGKLAKAT